MKKFWKSVYNIGEDMAKSKVSRFMATVYMFLRINMQRLKHFKTILAKGYWEMFLLGV